MRIAPYGTTRVDRRWIARYHGAMEPYQVPHTLSAPIYGIVAHAHIDLNLPASKYVMLQALALLQGLRMDRDTMQFYATIEDFNFLTNLSSQTIIKTLQSLEREGVISRKTAPFTPTLFSVNWSKTALTFEQSIDLGSAQQDLQEALDLM